MRQTENPVDAVTESDVDCVDDGAGTVHGADGPLSR